MTERIGKLIRTNIALAALCIIAIGALVSMFRGHGAQAPAGSAPGALDAGGPVISGQQPESSVSSVGDALSRSPFKGMPAPAKYQSFSYKPGAPISISGSCADAYRVIMIVPSSVDYRIDPSSAVYNDAAPCEAGHAFIERISLDSRTIVAQAGAGARYYVVRANEGHKGSWYGPY